MEELVQKTSIAQQDTWLDPSLVVFQIKKIQKIFKEIMKENIHYGPGFPGSDKIGRAHV